MKVTEEIDALKVMAFEPVEFVLAPKYLAALVAVPCLSVVSAVCGIFAGWIFMFFSTHLGLQLYFRYVLESIVLRDVLAGIIKSIAFATIIVLVGCLEGFVCAAGPTQWAGQRPPQWCNRPSWSSSPMRYSPPFFTLPGKTKCPIISVRDLVVEYDGSRVLDGLNLESSPARPWCCSEAAARARPRCCVKCWGWSIRNRAASRLKARITTCSPAELKTLRRSVGVSFQSAALFNSLTVEDNVALTLREHT